MRLLFNIKNQRVVEIQLIKGKKVINKTYLTMGQSFDILLIRSLDKFFNKNKIDRLSLKSVETSGEMRSGAMSSMILKTVVKALTI